MSDADRRYFEYLSRRSRLAHIYRRYWLYPRLCRHLQGRVLDVGCGIGDMLHFRPGTIGVDVNRQTVAACRAQGLDAREMLPDQLPFAESAFDSVVLDNVLEHLAQPSPLLCEIRRVLVPDGTLLVGVPGPRGYRTDPDHKIFYDAGNLRRTIEAQGFELRHLFRTPLDIAWLDTRVNAACVYGVFSRAGRGVIPDRP
jgi:SAM-dependent methyltransferase